MLDSNTHAYLVMQSCRTSCCSAFFVELSLLQLGRTTEYNKQSEPVSKKRSETSQNDSNWWAAYKERLQKNCFVNCIDLHISGNLRAALQDLAAPHALLILTIRLLTIITSELGGAS